MHDTKFKIIKALVKAKLDHLGTDNAVTWFRLAEQLHNGEIKASRHQRDDSIYSDKEKNRILTAFLLGRGIGCIEIVEDITGENRSIEDGLQRLTSLKEFFHGKYEVLLAHKEYKALQDAYVSEGVSQNNRTKISWNDLHDFKNDSSIAKYIGQVKKWPVLQTIQSENPEVIGNDFHTLSREKFRDTNILRKKLTIGERIASQYGEGIYNMLHTMSEGLQLKEFLTSKEISRKEDIRLGANLTRLFMSDYNFNDSPGEFKDLNNPILEQLSSSPESEDDRQPWDVLIDSGRCDPVIRGQTDLHEIMTLSGKHAGELLLANKEALLGGKGQTSLVLLCILLYHIVILTVKARKKNSEVLSEPVSKAEIVELKTKIGGGSNSSASVKQLRIFAEKVIARHMIF